MTPRRRTVVLTNDEVEAYITKFGPMYPAQILPFAIGPSGTRAIIELNQSWTGSTYLMTKTKDGWKTTILSTWIT